MPGVLDFLIGQPNLDFLVGYKDVNFLLGFPDLDFTISETVPGFILPFYIVSPVIDINAPPVVRLGDISSGHDCWPGRPNDEGSPNVFVNNLPVHTQGDHWDEHCCGVS